MRRVSRVCVDLPCNGLLDCPYRVAGTDVRLIVQYVSGCIKAYSYRLGSFSVLSDMLYQRLSSDSSIRAVDFLTCREDCILSVYRS